MLAPHQPPHLPRLGQTPVNEYPFPIYRPTFDSNGVVPYPTQQSMHYPKLGYRIPLVSALVLKFNSPESTLKLNGQVSYIQDG